MKNVLVLGSGAREVAIVRSISQSLIENSIFCISKDINPQISRLCKDYFVSDVEAVSSIVAYSKEKEIDLAIIGPENPLASGVVNELELVGVRCVGPKKEVAMIEASKSFARTIIDLCCPEKNPKITCFEDSVFTGKYCAGKISEEYLSQLEENRSSKE